MRSTIFVSTAVLVSTLALSTFATAQANDATSLKSKAKSAASEVKMATEEAYFDAFDKQHATVSFEKGTTDLSQSDKNKLQSLATAVKGDGEITKAYVGVWADEGQVESSAKDLADKRVEQVKKALNAIGIKDVETFSMADSPNWFEKTFGADQVTVKKAMADKDKSFEDKADRKLAAIGRTFASEGGVSKAVVILARDTSGSAH